MILARIFFSLFVLIPIVLGIRNLVRFKSVAIDQKQKLYRVAINSAVLYAIAYNLIFFVQELFLVLGKKSLGLTAYLYHNNHNWDGEHELTQLMQGSGALTIFILAILLTIVLLSVKKISEAWRLFLLWLIFHGFIQSIYQVVTVVFAPYSDMGQVFVGHFSSSEAVTVIMSLIGFLLIVLFCFWFTRQLLGFAPKETNGSIPKERLRHIRYIAVISAALGTLLILPFRLPPWEQALSPLLILTTVIPWVWVSATFSGRTTHSSENLKDRIRWIPVVFLILLLVVFIFVLAPGIRF